MNKTFKDLVIELYPNAKIQFFHRMYTVCSSDKRLSGEWCIESNAWRDAWIGIKRVIMLKLS